MLNAVFILALQASTVIPPQALVPIHIVEQGAAQKPKGAKPGRPFYFQRLVIAGQAKLLIEGQELDLFRDSYNLDDHAPFAPYDWVDAPVTRGGLSKHRDYVFCSTYLKLGKGVAAACFRDENRDGKFDAVARFEGGIPVAGLVFSAIKPVAYQYANNKDYMPPYSMYTVEQLGIGFELDKATGHLQFGIYGGAGYVPVAETINVDPANLPMSLNVYGATLKVSDWDGKKANVTVINPLPQTPVRIELPAFKKGRPIGRGHAVVIEDSIIR